MPCYLISHSFCVFSHFYHFSQTLGPLHCPDFIQDFFYISCSSFISAILEGMSPSTPKSSSVKSRVGRKYRLSAGSRYNMDLSDGMMVIVLSLEVILLKDSIRNYEALLTNENAKQKDLKNHWEAILTRVQGVELRRDEMERRKRMNPITDKFHERSRAR